MFVSGFISQISSEPCPTFTSLMVALGTILGTQEVLINISWIEH